MAWQFKFEEQVYKEADVRLDQWMRLEQHTDESWRFINPLARADHAYWVLSLLHADRTEEPIADVQKRVNAVTTSEFLALFKDVAEDDLPTMYDDGIPQQGASRSTTGSSGAPDDSAGPLT